MREIQDSDNIRDKKVIAGDSFPCNLFDKVTWDLKPEVINKYEFMCTD